MLVIVVNKEEHAKENVKRELDGGDWVRTHEEDDCGIVAFANHNANVTHHQTTIWFETRH